MRIYWTLNCIPELQELSSETRRAVLRASHRRLWRSPAFWLAPFLAFIAQMLGLAACAILSLWLGDMRIGYAGTLLVTALYFLGILVGVTALTRREIQKILAEERDAGEATPPTAK